MPSAFEPCGLSQMIAMRYGTLPVVHEIGGLKDSVRPFNPMTNQGTGFGFEQFRGFYLTEAIKQGLQVYHDSPNVWEKLQQAAMTTDFSWETSCQNYIDLYNRLL